MKKEHQRIWTEKMTHGYLQNKLNNNKFIDMKATNKWLDLRLTSHLEGYTVAIMEQEINTKETMKREENDLDKKRHMDTKCRICSRSEESVFHLVCSQGYFLYLYNSCFKNMEKPYYLQVFFELRKIGNNLIQLESHQEFLKKCHEAKIISKGFYRQCNVTYKDQELFKVCTNIQNEASFKIQGKVYNFVEMKRFEEHKQFITTKKKLFRSSETRAGSLFMTVKNEMNRLRLKLQRLKKRNGII